jgi:putative transposase
VLSFLLAFLIVVRVFIRSYTDTALEVLALRQQLGVLKRKRSRPRLGGSDRLFWVLLRQLWSRWAEALIIVNPDIVVGWHRAVFRLYWRWRSRRRGGRPRITEEIRVLIRRLAQENPDWGAPRIHGSASRSPKGALHDIYRVWCAGAIRAKSGLRFFLRNHREAIVGLDLFTVPTATFRVLYCLFVIDHERRRILHFNVTRHTSADWVVQQWRESFPEADPYRYAILDRDSIFDADVIAFLKVTGLRPKRTSRQSPSQNGTAERWIGSCRRRCSIMSSR